MATTTDPVATTLSPASDRPSWRWLRAGWPLYVLLTLLFGAYQGLNHAINLRSTHFAAWEPFIWELSSVIVIAALIPFIARFESQIRVDSRPRTRALLAHIAGGIVFSIVHTTGMVLIRKLTYALAGDSYDFGNVPVEWFYELQKDLLTYVSILLVVFAIREFRVRRAGELRAQELAAQLSEARLRHLTAQIEPHFLFNALNAISNRMHEDVDAADRMISQLGDLLRAAYESDDSVLVPLGRELGWLRGYTAMMAERFRGQLAFEIDVDPDIDTLRVPRLLLQPIVENAIRHGLQDGHGWLKVEVRRRANELHYTVSDDGIGLPEKPLQRGTGLSNISRRLELLFPNRHNLAFGSREPRGAVVSLIFPVST
ncbi:MAG: sensor histidine kinase [Steroidobacteraceae bacterium]